jgi:hypothetical protein
MVKRHKRHWFFSLFPETQALLILTGLAVGLGLICGGLFLRALGY